MHRSNRPVLIAATIGVMLVGVGCGNTTAGTPGSSPAAAAAPADPATWAGSVCDSFTTFIAVTSTQPTIDKSSPQSIVDSISAYSGKVADSLDEAKTKLEASGPSPIANGDAALKQATDAVAGYRAKFQAAKDNLDKVDPNDSAAINAAVKPITDLENDPNPLKPLEDIPAFKTAETTSDKCKDFIKFSETAGN